MSLGAGMLFTYFLFGKVRQHYVSIFFMLALFYVICFTVMCTLVKEGEYGPPPPPVHGGGLRAILSCCRRIFPGMSDQALLPLALPFLSAGAYGVSADQPVLGLFLSVGRHERCGLWEMVGAAIRMLICAGAGRRMVGRQIASTAAHDRSVFLYAATTGLAFAFVHDAATFAAAHVICGTCSGFWITSTAPLAPALFPRLKFATFASALVIANAIASSLLRQRSARLSFTLTKANRRLAGLSRDLPMGVRVHHAVAAGHADRAPVLHVIWRSQGLRRAGMIIPSRFRRGRWRGGSSAADEPGCSGTDSGGASSAFPFSSRAGGRDSGAFCWAISALKNPEYCGLNNGLDALGGAL